MLHKKILYVLSPVPIFVLAISSAAFSLVPPIAFYDWCSVTLMPHLGSALSRALCLALGFYIYGFSLILIAPAMNLIFLRGRLRPWRGPAYSIHCLPWYLHNALTMLARFTFLEFITPTAFNVFFFRLMGMRTGTRCFVNSTAISDPSLIELGDEVTIGGSATLAAHYSQGGFLVLAPIRIGNRATIGLRATILGGVEIGERAKVLAHSFVLPNSKIPAGETWGGIPARKLQLS